MFEHSVKVPRPYKLAANIFKKVATEGGSVKTLLYDDKLRHFRTNALYALITETIKHSSLIDKLFENCNVLADQPRLDPWLAKVLTAELLFGKKSLPGKSKPESTISSYKEQFEKYTADHQEDIKSEAVRRPRFVRINTNLLTTSDAIRAFQEEGFRFIRCTSGSYDDYLKQIQELSEYDFTQDYHVKTVYVFPSGTRWHDHELYLQNQIVLQDKATTMAVHLLAPPQGSVVLDMCAAPGMKTTQLAAYMRNEGKIYAVERNESRYKTLCDFVAKTGSKCVQTLHKDALEIKRGDYDDVEYILLDPSCSGSGMDYNVHNYVEATRLSKLTSLQEKFLKHAMNSFPNAKRIVYSTCSLYPEENERVVSNTVKVSRAKWRVQDVKELLKGQWNNFGSSMYGSMGVRCMYSKPDSDFTTGFFLAVLDRDPNDMEKQRQTIQKATSGESEILDEGKKEKRQKKKYKGEELSAEADHVENYSDIKSEHNMENGDALVNNGSRQDKRKKKKYKREYKLANQLSSEADPNAEEVENYSAIKSERIENGDALEHVVSKKDKSKKNKLKIEDKTDDQLNTEGETAEVQSLNVETAKKLKKKSLVADDDIVDNTQQGILDNSEQPEENGHKKKKKKRKMNVEQEVMIENNEVPHEENKRDRKKRKNKALLDEASEDTSEVPIRKRSS